METKETDNEKKSQEANFHFSFGNFQKMAEMMKNCFPGEGGAIDCCSMMRKMMDCGKAGETKKTQKPSNGVQNA